MKSIEQVLSSGDSFSVDSMACMLHAQKIKNYKRPIEKFGWSDESKAIQLGFKVAFISICHQFNWDVMQNALAENLLLNPEKLIHTLNNIKASDLNSWLNHYPKKERIKAPERTKILKNVGKVLVEKFDGSLQLFYDTCTNSALDKQGSSESFHAIMDNFLGYRTDSLRKKTNVLSHDLIKEDIVRFKDPENANPAIDYHIMRLYLRTGRVIPNNEIIFKFLEGSPNPRGTLVRQLREAVSRAEQLTAYYSNLNVADVNYIEWQIARSVCTNKEPQCTSISDPLALPNDIRELCSSCCPYSEECISNNELPRFISFEEPIYISTDY
jgi:hypothetical protein